MLIGNRQIFTYRLPIIIGALIFLMSGNLFALNPLQISLDENTVSIKVPDRLLFCYQYHNVPYKPYVRWFSTPSGVNILRDAPHDHKHHHALMFAVTVDGVNFWEEYKAQGRQAHLSLDNFRIDRHNDTPQAGFTEQINWINPRNNQFLLREHRTIETYLLKEAGVSLMTWQSGFQLPPGKKSAELTGSHYFGLGMRFLQSMVAGGKFFNSDKKKGKIFRGSERLCRALWCAYSASADGQPVTVAMFDHPANPRHPAAWFTMTDPFAYLSATLNLHQQPLKIETGKLLKLRYAVALWDGTVDRNRIEKLYRQWITWPTPEPATDPKPNQTP